MNALAQQNLYLDSSQYSDLKKGVRANNEEANTTALQQFESLFISQMLKEMRSAAVIDEDQHSSYMDFYTDMYDKQLATIMAKQGGIGIAKQLEEQLAIDANINHKKEYLGGKFLPLNPVVAATNGLPLKATDKGMAFSSKDQERTLTLPVSMVSNVEKADNITQLTKPSVLQSDSKVNVIPLTVSHALNKVVLAGEFHQIQNKVDNSAVKLTALDSQALVNQSLVDEKIQLHNGWTQPNEFIKELMPHAQALAKELGVKPEVIVAQSALETGWGKHTIRHSDGSISFSLFGIKADHRWSGDTVQVSTLEYKNGHMQKEMAHFRAYDSVGEAIQDYVAFIKNSTRYQNALNNNGDDAHYVKGLQKAGYATDPSYANKILNILQSNTLKQGLASIESHREVA